MINDLVLKPDDYEPDHVKHSVGGMGGHLFRRAVHLAMAILPLIYYWHGEHISDIFGITPPQFASAVVLILITAEAVRLKTGSTIVGQREYEAHQISALAWGAISVVLVLLIAPEGGLKGAAYGVPLIWALTFVDPLMGELRRADAAPRTVAVAGVVACALVWGGSGFWLGTPLWRALLMAPVTVAAEWPRLRWIDDNGMMVLVPLPLLLLLHPWIV